jgi:hypothetical protein
MLTNLVACLRRLFFFTEYHTCYYFNNMLTCGLWSRNVDENRTMIRIMFKVTERNHYCDENM